MADEEDKKTVISEWEPLHSPTTFFSTFMAEDFNNSRSFSQLLSSQAIESPSAQEPSFSATNSSSCSDNISDPFIISTGLPAGSAVGTGGFASGLKPPVRVNGGSFADRMAARGGFNAPRLNTARFKSAPPSCSPVARSPYLTIPPGLSPTTLLDSPVLLSNSLAEQSPTTGTYTSPPFLYESAISAPLTSGSDIVKEKNCEDGNSSLFVFKPHVKSSPNSCLSPLGGLATHGSSQQQTLAGFQAQAESQVQPGAQTHIQAQGQAQDESKAAPTSVTTKELVEDSLTQPALSRNYRDEAKCIAPLQTLPPGFPPDHAGSAEEQQQRQGSDAQLQFPEGNQKAPAPQNVIGRPSEDGYNWRKYGQKQVKGSEYPRSYYKCTHPNCQMKKKVERSHDGQITEIVYKGVHNHSKPQPSRRSAVSAAHMIHEGEERTEGSSATVKVEGGSTWRNTQLGLLKDRDTADSSQGWRNEGLERSSSASVVTDLSDPSSAAQGQSSIRLEAISTPEPSSILASDDDGEDGGTQGCKSLGEDADEDESDSKRRKKESNTADIIAASRTVREPRVVVQTTSEIDILDDGYRWRKYGQKVVKGNPNPRSYYKCTNAGCPVRKHVERASHDLKAVITTYEGKHNHDVPAARNSNHDNSGRGNGPPASAVQNNVTGPVITMPRSGPQVQDSMSRIDSHSEFGNDYGKHTYFGRVANESLHPQVKNTASIDLKLGAGMGFGMFGVDNRHSEKWQTTEAPHSFSMQMHGSSDLGLVGVELNGGKHTVPIQAYLGQVKENDIRLLRPKEEQKDDSGLGNSLPMNHSSNSSVYHQIMGRLSMGL